MAPIFAQPSADDAPPAPPIAAPIFPAQPQMPDDVQAYPNEGGPGAMVINAIHSLFTLPQRAIDGSAADVQHLGDHSQPLQSVGPAVETALTMMGGGLGGAEMKAGETALGAGPIRATLPMDEASRMARAAEQGYTIDAYKGGQPHDWNTMPETNGMGKVIAGTENRIPQELTSINSPNADYAGFFSHDPAVADRFAAPYDRGGVWPVKLKFDNPLVIDARGEHAAAFQFPSIARERGTFDEMNAFKGAFKDGSPHDGVILKNTKDEGDVYVPRNPDQIRSRFAAFDPASKGSGKLLGSLAGATAAPIFAGASRSDK